MFELLGVSLLKAKARTLEDTVVDTLVEAEVDLLAVTLVMVEIKTPFAT